MTAKVLFEIEQESDGFPPIRMEMLNATHLRKGVYRIENSPFFVTGISYHDEVRVASTEVADQFLFEALVQRSSFTALSIILMDTTLDSSLMDLLRGRNCVIEYGEFGVYRVLAVAVPASEDYVALRNDLQEFEDEGLISFAELAVAGD